jgi:single-strand DNA-binding protein
MSINKVILVGNVGKDPVIRYFDKGVAKVNFPLATSETYTNQQGETVTTTEWHNIVLWRALAEVAEKTVKKGSQVYIVGKIKTRSYVDKDGVNKYITEILADTFLLLDKKGPYPKSEEKDTHEMIKEPAPGYPSEGYSGKENDVSGISSINKEEASPQDEDDLPF